MANASFLGNLEGWSKICHRLYLRKLRKECLEQKATWPLSPSRKAVADQFAEACNGVPGKDWMRVRVLSEGGVTVEKFLREFAKDLPEPVQG